MPHIVATADSRGGLFVKQELLHDWWLQPDQVLAGVQDGGDGCHGDASSCQFYLSAWFPKSW